MTDFIKEFWDNQANKHGQLASASWDDNWAVNLEVEAVGKHIKEDDLVLDVGCANGHATLRQAANKPITIIGVDYSEAMIEKADKALDEYVKDESSNKLVSFSVADIKALPFENETFDVVYTTRVLINLPTWEEQIKGIHECIRVTKKGGTIILSEGFYEPLQKLNALRLVCGLQPLFEHDFNRYIKKERLEDHLSILCNSWISGFECDDFSSIYYLGSRFIRELVTDKDAYAGYSNPINKIFYKIETNFSGGGCGIQQAYIIKK
jgi:ubiquinone/menaquinone biosynthesis C-methylase UbiE